MEQHATVIDALRQRLLARRRDIIGRVVRTEDVLGELDPSRSVEAEEEAQDLNQARLLDQLGRRGRAEIDAIDVAITRMERGDYGFCEECEEPIDVARLEVLPIARTCTTCAETNERRGRQMSHVTLSISTDEDD